MVTCVCRKTIGLAVCLLGGLEGELMLNDEPEFTGTTGGDTVQEALAAKARISDHRGEENESLNG